MPASYPASQLDDRIALARRNLAELMENIAAYSGAGDEELAAQRIAAQQKQLDDLLQEREELRRKG